MESFKTILAPTVVENSVTLGPLLMMVDIFKKECRDEKKKKKKQLCL